MAKEILYKDEYCEVIFKYNTRKVIIGKNILSYFKSKHRSFYAKTREEAISIAEKFLNKKINT